MIRLDHPTWLIPGASFTLAPGVRARADHLVDDAGTAYPLNDTGSLLCQLAAHDTDVDVLVAATSATFDIPADQAHDEVSRFVSGLAGRGLLSVHQSFLRESLSILRHARQLTLASTVDRSLIRRGSRFPARRYRPSVGSIIRGCVEAHQGALWWGLVAAAAVAALQVQIDTLNLALASTLAQLVLIILVYVMLIPITALAHELGHYAVARRLGVRCSSVFVRRGVVGIAYERASRRHTLAVTLAGPLSGLLVVAVCAGLWWLAGPTVWVALGMDQLSLSFMAALGAIALMQAASLTPMSHDGRVLAETLWGGARPERTHRAHGH